jgi:LPXTG-motif cell wall-anchored protein
LTIDTTKVKVKVGSGVEQTVELNGVYNVDGSKATSESYDFKVEELSGTEWLISFSANYLTKKATGNPKVLVKYEATVSASQFNVNEMTNTADVEYTHTPDGETTHETDDTHHYTYSLDGKLKGKGETEDITKELVKVGVDQNGNPIVTEEVTSVNKQQVTNALKGATFKLTAKNAKDANNKPIEYTAESKADGTITFNGLDAGEYTLEEVSAPLGWIKDDTKYNVKITPTFKVEEADTAHKGCYVLDKYTVEVTDADGNTKTSTFNMKYEKDGQTNEVVMTSSDGDDATFIKNKKAGLLPSTGGSGIFFYLAVGGAIAGISLYLMKKDEHAEAAE